MAVAMIAPTVMKTAEMNAKRVMKRDHQRVFMARGEQSRRMKFMQIPARKKTNMAREPTRRRVRTVLTSDGRAIVAPASSCDTRTATGLNQ